MYTYIYIYIYRTCERELVGANGADVGAGEEHAAGVGEDDLGDDGPGVEVFVHVL